MAIRIIRLLLSAVLVMGSVAQAADITLFATLDGRAVFVINGARRTVQVGEKTADFRLVAITADSAIIESGGSERRLGLGEGYVAAGGNADRGGGRLTLSPDEQGHYYVDIGINGHRQRGVVDTGATHLSVSRAVAASLGISYVGGEPKISQTANGLIRAWLVKVPQVQVGTITVYDVDAIVRDTADVGPVLIGTSLLNRFQMSRDQGLMVLSKKPN